MKEEIKKIFHGNKFEMDNFGPEGQKRLYPNRVYFYLFEIRILQIQYVNRKMPLLPFIKTIQSLFKARLLGMLILSAMLALAVILLLVVIITSLTGHYTTLDPPWLNGLITVLAGILSGIGGWFMLPALTIFIAGMFQDRIVKKIEQNYYPDRIYPGQARFWPDFWHDIKFTMRALLLNVLLLPFYLFGIGLFFSVLLNAYLLGREFFESAAGYHLGKPGTNKLRQKYQVPVFLGGLMITIINLIPIANLLTPVIGTAWMTHLFQTIAQKEHLSIAQD